MNFASKHTSYTRRQFHVVATKKKYRKHAERRESKIVNITKGTRRQATECGRWRKEGLDECKSRKRRIVRRRGVTPSNNQRKHGQHMQTDDAIKGEEGKLEEEQGLC